MKKLFALLVCVLLVFTLVSCDDDPCQHRDADDNSLCDNCGESYTDGKDVDDNTPCSHRDADDNSLCDKCGESYTDGKDVEGSTPCSHRDADDNSLCDNCGESYTDGKDLPDDPVHTHSYILKNTDSKYLDKAADCENAATYFYSCSCGEKSTETFTSGSENGHSYTVKNTDSKYLDKAADCENAATYYYSCSCGAKGSATFTYGNSLGHSYTVQNTDSKYLATAADCGNAATYYYSCACGAKGTATFASGNSLGHRDANDNSLCDKCNKPYTDETDITVLPESISFDNATASIEVGDTITLNANFSPSNTTDKTLTWISSDTSIAMVTNGMVLGIKPGSTTIIAMTANGKTATCLINVSPKTYYAESVTLDKNELELAIGYSYTLSATVLPNYATDKSVTWSSSDSSIVKVNNGKVSAVSAGTATVTATTSNGKSATCTVTSLFIPATDIIINEQIIYVDAGKSGTVNATTVPENATVSSLVWSSSNTDIATVKDGVITGVADGIAVITVSTADGGITKKFNVVVENSAEIVYTSYGSGYSVSSLNKITDTVIIPDTYKGKPVTSISSGVFGTECYVIKNLYIGKNITSLSAGILKNCTKLETLSIPGVEYDYIGDLFGTMSITWEGGIDNFSPVDDTYKYNGYYDFGYEVPQSYTDWFIYHPNAGWYNVNGVYVFVNNDRVTYANVSSWQTYTVTYYSGSYLCVNVDSYKVPKEVNLTAYRIPKTLVNIYKSDSNAITLEASSACVDKVKDLKVTFNEVNKPLAELISFPDLEKIKMAGTYDLTVYFNGYMGTVRVTVTGHMASDAVQENYVDSNCTQTGSYDSVCYCYSCKTELSREKKTVAAKGHTASSEVKENNVEATCTKTGAYDSVVYCGACNSELSRNTVTVNAKGHDYIDHEAKAVTCLNIGWDAYRTCSRCDYTSYEEIEALGHDYVNHAAKDATCTAVGWYEYDTCSRCSYSTYKEIAKLGHDYVHHDAKTKTCTDIGWKAYDTCSRCDYTTYVEIPASHNPKSAVTENRVESKCNEEGTYQSVVYCRDCNEELSRTNKEIIRSHKMSSGRCTVCGLQQSSSGLKFTLNSDGKGYTLTGIGSCTSNNIVIGVYNNLSVTRIGGDAFNNNKSLTCVTIGDSVTSIGYDAFRDCTSLTIIEIPDTVTSIGHSAFSCCTSLTSVVIGDSVTSIDSWAFNNCTSLTSVHITDIAAWCNISFGDSSANPLLYATDLYLNGELVTDLVIPDSVTSIGSYAFYGCKSLTSVTIPDSVTSIGERAFYNCTALEEIYFNATAMNNLSYDNYVFYNAGKNGNGIKVVIGANVTKIPAYLFYPDSSSYSPKITSVEFEEESVCTSIGYAAFYHCDSLTSVKIPDSVIGISDHAFQKCYKLQSVTIGNSVTSIGYSAFNQCSSLTSVTIPNSVTSIDVYAFSDCTSLTSVTIPDSVTSIGSLAFDNCTSLTSVHITDIAAWCNISFGNNYANPLYYAENLYLNGALVTELVIPDSVTSIGSYAFYRCKSLTSVTIPDSVTSIGERAFAYCDSLTSFTVDENNSYYKSIDGNLYSKDGKTLIQYAYAIGKTDTTFTVPSSVTSIGEFAFAYCDSLTSVVIGDSVTSIGSSAFYSCDSLTSVTIGDSVTSIGSSAFAYCDSLTSVTIGDSVTSIGDYAFSGCKSLKSIKYRGTQSQWYAISKGYYWNQYYSDGNDYTINYTITYNYAGE